MSRLTSPPPNLSPPAPTENPEDAKKEREFQEIKNAIEQIMEEKVVQRRAVQETFAWDMLQVLPSIPSCDT